MNNKQIIKLLNNNTPKISTDTSTSVLFEGRKEYVNNYTQYFNIEIPLIDTWYESSLYGKIDNFGKPLFVNKQYLTNLTTTNIRTISNYLVLDIVAEAFKDLKKEIEEKIKYGRIQSSHITDLIPKGKFTSLDDSYKERQKFVINSITNQAKKNNEIDIKIKDFDSYLKTATLLLGILPNLRITKSNHLLSYKTSINVSGLVIDLGDYDFNNDVQKYTDYLSDPNFKFFQKTCLKYGFLLDKNIPSRLIFVPTLEQSKKYLEKFNIKDINEMFETRYERSYHIDYLNLKNLLINGYTDIIKYKGFTQSKKICSNRNKLSIVSSKRIKRKAFTLSVINKSYDNLFWIKLYLYIFLKENQIFMDQAKFNSYIKNLDLMYKVSEKACLNYLETICVSIKNISAFGTNQPVESSLTENGQVVTIKASGFKFYY
jgi:hypothetical protein